MIVILTHNRKKLLILLTLLFSYSLYSQSLSVFDVDATGFPIIKAKFYALDANGKQIINLLPKDFEVKENGQTRTVTNVSCKEPPPPGILSSVLVMDASGSMANGNLELAKAAAEAWIDGIQDGQSECAITAFNVYNFMVQDFTSNKNLLLQNLNTLFAAGGTDYDAAFLKPMAGGLLITKTGKNKKVIVFLSDGMPYRDPLTTKIIAEANTQNVSVYSVILKMPAPQFMKDISAQTGGQCFENVTSFDQAKQIYKQILLTAEGCAPCTIEWESKPVCTQGIVNVDINLIPYDKITTASYQTTSSAVAMLEFSPSTVKFFNTVPGIKRDTTIKVTAINGDFDVTNITRSSSEFTIVPTSFSLASGQSTTLTLSLMPVDSGYSFCKYEFVNDYCPVKYYVSGGFQGKKPSVNTLKLVHPNGGELLQVDIDTVITWEGVLPGENVIIEYSTNNGTDWKTITGTATGLSYKWHVPMTPSNQCLAKVTAAIRYTPECEGGIVQICDQLWMTCNLNVDHYRNGDSIPEVRDPKQWESIRTGAWCYYNNDPELGIIYGKLYNWYAVNDPRGLAPFGWHIPSKDEFTVLENCVLKSEAGGSLKSTGTKESWDGLWLSPNTGATNDSRFSGLPGGYRSFNSFHNIESGAYWWSSSSDSSIAFGIGLGYGSTNISNNRGIKIIGYSVRCIKD